mgnify:CR=1 FL=1
MSASKQIYDLIASRQAMSVSALMLATGMPEATVRSNIYFLRVSNRIARASRNPATYAAVAMSEPPKAYRPRKAKAAVLEDFRQDADTIVAKALAKPHALHAAWGGGV